MCAFPQHWIVGCITQKPPHNNTKYLRIFVNIVLKCMHILVNMFVCMQCAVCGVGTSHYALRNAHIRYMPDSVNECSCTSGCLIPSTLFQKHSLALLFNHTYAHTHTIRYKLWLIKQSRDIKRNINSFMLPIVFAFEFAFLCVCIWTECTVCKATQCE